MPFLLLPAALLVGAEVPVYDLGLVAEARPSDFAFTWSRNGVTRSGDDAFAHAYAAGVVVRRGFGQPGAGGQWLLGGEAMWIDEPFGSGGRSGPLLRGEAGWGYGLADDLLASATLAVGGGWMAFRLPGGIFGDQRLDGTVLEGGPRLGLRWAVAPRLALTGEAGWLLGRDHHAGDGIVLDIERSGGWLALSCAWVIDAGPRRVK